MQQGPVLSLSINKHKASAELGSELELVDLQSQPFYSPVSLTCA